MIRKQKDQKTKGSENRNRSENRKDQKQTESKSRTNESREDRPARERYSFRKKRRRSVPGLNVRSAGENHV